MSVKIKNHILEMCGKFIKSLVFRKCGEEFCKFGTLVNVCERYVPLFSWDSRKGLSNFWEREGVQIFDKVGIFEKDVKVMKI